MQSEVECDVFATEDFVAKQTIVKKRRKELLFFFFFFYRGSSTQFFFILLRFAQVDLVSIRVSHTTLFIFLKYNTLVFKQLCCHAASEETCNGCQTPFWIRQPHRVEKKREREKDKERREEEEHPPFH